MSSGAFLPIGAKVILPNGSCFTVDATEVDGRTVTARQIEREKRAADALVEEVVPSAGC